MRYWEEVLPCGGAEALAQGAQRSCGCPIPVGVDWNTGSPNILSWQMERWGHRVLSSHPPEGTVALPPQQLPWRGLQGPQLLQTFVPRETVYLQGRDRNHSPEMLQ